MKKCRHLIGLEHETYETFLVYEDTKPLDPSNVEWFQFCPYCGQNYVVNKEERSKCGEH